MEDVWERVEQDEKGDPLELATDPDGTLVFLSRAVWQEHILKHHPEMRHFKDIILQAVYAPIEREIEDPGRKFIRAYADIPPERQPSSKRTLQVRVVIKYVEPPERDHQRTGLLSSAYLVRRRKA